jgi:hypothetical protein
MEASTQTNDDSDYNFFFSQASVQQDLLISQSLSIF